MQIQIGKQYFEGYEEKFIPKVNGKGYKKMRVYLGDIYRLECSDREWMIRKGIMTVCIFAFFSMMLGFGSMRTLANVSVYVMLPFAIGLISGGYCAIGVFNAVAAPRDMTAFQYREQHMQLKRGAKLSACAMAACTAANLVCLAVWGLGGQIAAGTLPKELMVLLSNVVCMFLMTSLYQMEKKAAYTRIPGRGSAEADDGAYSGCKDT